MIWNVYCWQTYKAQIKHLTQLGVLKLNLSTF